jgi:hypothetical protein
MTQPVTQEVTAQDAAAVETVTDVLAELESQVHDGMTVDEFKAILHRKLKTIETREKAQFKLISQLRERLDNAAKWSKRARKEMARLNQLTGSLNHCVVLMGERLTALEAKKIASQE